jgi:hypothetical protein
LITWELKPANRQNARNRSVVRRCESPHSIVAAIEFAGPGFASFVDGEVDDREAGDGVRPPPADGGVETDTGQCGGGQDGAERCFGCIGP